MNKKVLFGMFGLAAGSLMADSAVATFNPYVAIKGGYSILSKKDNIKYKNGFLGAVEFGVSYDAWRLGLEVNYRSNKIKESNFYNRNNIAGVGSIPAGHAANDNAGVAATHYNKMFKDAKYTSLGAMINAYYDYALTDECSLYLGLGLGVARVSCKTTKVEAVAGANAVNGYNTFAIDSRECSKTVFAWQVMAGVAYDINENWTVEAGYRLFNTAKVKFDGKNSIKAPFASSLDLGLRYNF